MANYLVPIDLFDEPSWENIIKTTVGMATGVDDAKIYLMTVVRRDHIGHRCALRHPR